MTPSTSSESCQEQFGKISIAASAREAIVRGDRQGALRLLNSLVLAGAQRAAALTPQTADALVATATAEHDQAALERYGQAEASYRMIADQIQRAAFEREHIAGLRALLDARERELDVAESRLVRWFGMAAAESFARFLIVCADRFQPAFRFFFEIFESNSIGEVAERFVHGNLPSVIACVR